MEINRFFHLHSGAVIPMIPKCGLASTHSAIFKQMVKMNHHGRMSSMIRAGHDNKPALVPIRDVVERFRSAVWQVNKGGMAITVDYILDGIESGDYQNHHFISQSKVMESCEGCESVKLYRFPEDFDQMLIDGGLDPRSERRNESNGKPELTHGQTQRVMAIYSADVTLRDSLNLPSLQLSNVSTI